MIKIRIPTTFKPLLLETDDAEYLFESKKYEISLKLAEAILYCVEHNKKKITFVEIEVENEENITSLEVHESNFLESLDEIMPTLIKHEEYEWCAEIVKMKEKLKEKFGNPII